MGEKTTASHRRGNMFTGSYLHQVDSKGRVSIPAKFRYAVDSEGYPKFKLIKGIGDCLVLVTTDDFARVEGEYHADFPTFLELIKYKRAFLSRAITVNTDPQGRVMIPMDKLDEVGISKEVLIIGVGEWIELWNKEKYDKYIAEISPADYEAMALSFFSALARFKRTRGNEDVGNDTAPTGDG